jgi:hypothetical protein
MTNKRASATRRDQMEFVFNAKTQVEFNGIEMGVLESGTPYLTGRGLAKMCGISEATLRELSGNWQEEKEKRRGKAIDRLLNEHGFSENNLLVPVRVNGAIHHAYTDLVCMSLLEYYAFDAAETRKEATANYRLLARYTFRSFIYEKTGYSPQIDRWKYFLDRVDLNADTVPMGYFSIFREMNGLIVTLINGNVLVDDNTIPDLSVGMTWGKYWVTNDLFRAFGERIKYEHNFPDYYPQAKSNPQEPWAYPNACLPTFREWFYAEYVDKKFPAYLTKKVKAQSLGYAEMQHLLAVVQPKLIEQK